MRAFATVTIAIAVAVAATAAAGDASNPEVTDPAQDAGAGNAWGDITSAWVNDTATDIVVTMQVAVLPPAQPPQYIYYWTADAGQGDNATIGCFAFIDGGSPAFGCAHWENGFPIDDLPGSGSVTPGQPGTVVLNLPRAEFGDWPAGTALTGLQVGSGEGAFAPVPTPVPVGTFLPDDNAQASRDYVLANGPAGAAGVPGGPTTQGNGTAGNGTGQNATGGPAPAPAPAPTPGLELPLAVAAASVVALLGRRRPA